MLIWSQVYGNWLSSDGSGKRSYADCHMHIIVVWSNMLLTSNCTLMNKHHKNNGLRSVLLMQTPAHHIGRPAYARKTLRGAALGRLVRSTIDYTTALIPDGTLRQFGDCLLPTSNDRLLTEWAVRLRKGNWWSLRFGTPIADYWRLLAYMKWFENDECSFGQHPSRTTGMSNRVWSMLFVRRMRLIPTASLKRWHHWLITVYFTLTPSSVANYTKTRAYKLDCYHRMKLSKRRLTRLKRGDDSVIIIICT